MLHPCEKVISPVGPFLTQATQFILEKTSIPIRSLEIDHICFRCASKEEYTRIIGDLVPEHGELRIEGMIGGRPIATIALHEAIAFESWKIGCIEIPCPKPGREYASGLEHMEVVIAPLLSSDAQPATPHHSKPHLEAFVRQYAGDGVSALTFDTRAIDKEVNADVSLSVSSDASVKFHLCSLLDVTGMEKREGLVEPVPGDYFS